MRVMRLLMFVTALGAAADARAQVLQWEDQGFVGVSLGAQAQSRDFTVVSAPTIYNEPGLLTTEHDVGGGFLFDLTGGLRIWNNFGAALSYSRFSDSHAPTVVAQVPHPLFFNRPRTATATAEELTHTESILHFQALWMLPVSDKIELAFMTGPSIFEVSQELLTGDLSSQVVEGPGSTSVTLQPLPGVKETSTSAGFTIGVDATYLVTPEWGAGAFIRYSGASVDLPIVGGATVDLDVGGFQIGFGGRMRF
jgi:hypothetical protein